MHEQVQHLKTLRNLLQYTALVVLLHKVCDALLAGLLHSSAAAFAIAPKTCRLLMP